MLIPLSLMFMAATPKAASTWIPYRMSLIRFNSTACFSLDTFNIPFPSWPSLFLLSLPPY